MRCAETVFFSDVICIIQETKACNGFANTRSRIVAENKIHKQAELESNFLHSLFGFSVVCYVLQVSLKIWLQMQTEPRIACTSFQLCKILLQNIFFIEKRREAQIITQRTKNKATIPDTPISPTFIVSETLIYQKNY